MKKSIIICLMFLMAYQVYKIQTVEDRLIGNWKLIDWYDDTARDIDKDGNLSTDLFSQWHGCKKQSVLILSENHTSKIIYKGENNNLKCPPNFKEGSFFSTDPWEITNEKSLRFNGNDYDDTYEIIELDSKILILKGSGFMTCCDVDISYFTGGYLKFKKE